MKKLIAPLALAAVLALTGCSNSEQAGPALDTTESAVAKTAPTPTPTPAPDLIGDWKQNNTKSDDGWTAATITGNTITVKFITDNGDTTSLFWVGTFTAPKDAKTPYTWTSTRDKAATDSALLASTDDTKDFVFDKDEISFPVSIAGTSTTVRMSKN
ncbi:hypothetical protein DEJ30_08235 [Curtobacterium sp. MCPF17_003]|uniref:hypothetical protein n=1 Tax=Curtobacterium sp. MCPF17_003 TaxID=2175637 RepID=UPI000D841A26|nr:hypothetical protein [Curtobacterium sp. MCPF17_003]PYY64442.1 hypothetical protein DEJ30_08235 [Curtobacterium sp. MCPF17_003]